ncbi:AEC family transporter [Sporosarcina cyprini]|uniref:AEC family transporter n=1 Tax=Sporosarcina cyprini TaxID=2910523 RepID=UPI001EDD277A|nr:AEC family transporter [Sporosarcina cyprini]MCG3088260.1 AEC family transporter [Sporosarcina cyprini]
MALGLILHSIGIITLMIGIGVLLARTFHFNADTRNVFISLIVNVGMPCIILSSIFQIEIDGSLLRKIGFVFLFSIGFNVIGIGIGYLFAILFHKKVNRARELAILSGLGNTGFIGIPLCAVLLGPEGALYAAIFDAGVDFTIWTVGALLLQKNPRIGLGMLRTMINPPLLAIIIGMAMVVIGYHPPYLLQDLFDRLAAIAAPLAMFYIGIMIMSLIQTSSQSIKNSRSTLWLPISVKLVLMPIFAVMVGKALSLDNIMLQTMLIQAAMPTLTLSSILFAKYSADEEMGIVTTIISTLAALFTIPVIIYLLNLYLL